MVAALDRSVSWEGMGSKDYKLESGKWKGENAQKSEDRGLRLAERKKTEGRGRRSEVDVDSAFRR